MLIELGRASVETMARFPYGADFDPLLMAPKPFFFGWLL